MLVRDVMTDYVVAASLDTTLNSVMGAMDKHGVRHLPVMDRGAVVGILSKRELGAVASVAAHFGAGRDDYEAYMDSSVRVFLKTRFMAEADVIVAGPAEPLKNALDRLVEHRLSALPVADSDGQLVGIISYIDILEALGELLESGSDEA
ncbi:MAG: CBS domain-containing protein [Persicimonas sp.]